MLTGAGDERHLLYRCVLLVSSRIWPNVDLTSAFLMDATNRTSPTGMKAINLFPHFSGNLVRYEDVGVVENQLSGGILTASLLLTE